MMKSKTTKPHCISRIADNPAKLFPPKLATGRNTAQFQIIAKNNRTINKKSHSHVNWERRVQFRRAVDK